MPARPGHAPCLALVVGALALLAGCGARGATAKTAQGETIPMIEVSPGVAGRLAIMDAYRQNDDMRKHMMWRPEVTVEELPPEEEPADEATPAVAPTGDASDADVSATTLRQGRTSK